MRFSEPATVRELKRKEVPRAHRIRCEGWRIARTLVCGLQKFERRLSAVRPSAHSKVGGHDSIKRRAVEHRFGCDRTVGSRDSIDDRDALRLVVRWLESEIST